MKILLFGATGKLGNAFLTQALESKHEVTAICRNPEKLTNFKNENLIVVVGDATELNDLDDFFKEKDAVVSCLGEYRAPIFTVSLYTTFVEALIPKIKQFKIKKFIVCSASGTVVSERNLAPWFARWVVFPMISSVLENMGKMEEMLKASDINYVVVRPTHLVNELGTQEYCVEECSCSPKLGPRIPLADVAHFFLSCLNSEDYDRKMVAIGSKVET